MSGRILFCADASSVHTQRWVAAMAERGFECLIATRRPARVPGAAEVITLRPGADAAGWFLALPTLRRLAQRLQPQWLHGHYVTSYGLWAAACRGAVDAPLVQTAWGSDLLVTPRAPGWHGRVMAALVRWTLRRADLVTGDSLDLVAAADAYGLKRPAQRIHWGADTARFHPVPWAGKPGFGIASLRAWDANYRIELIVDALGRLLHDEPAAPLHLHLLGGGPQEAALRARVRSLGLHDRVSFHGRVDDAGMQAVLAQCKVSVSIPASDATSVAMLESMACGLPVVASDLPANREWLGDNDGLWVPAGDDPVAAVQALAAALRVLWRDESRAQALGARHRARIDAEGRRDRQMDAMAALYRQLLAGAGAGARR